MASVALNPPRHCWRVSRPLPAVIRASACRKGGISQLKSSHRRLLVLTAKPKWRYVAFKRSSHKCHASHAEFNGRSQFSQSGPGSGSSRRSQEPSAAASSSPSASRYERASQHEGARRYERRTARGTVRGNALNGSGRPASPDSSWSPSSSPYSANSANSANSAYSSAYSAYSTMHSHASACSADSSNSANSAHSSPHSPSSPDSPESTASPAAAAAAGEASEEFPFHSHHTILDVDQVDPTAADAAWGGLDPAAAAAAWKQSFLKRVVDTITDSKYFNLQTAGWLMAGAATAAVGVQVTAHIIQAIESVPLLAALEILIGASVTTNVATTIAGGGEARERLEQHWDEFVRRVTGTYGLSDPAFDEIDAQGDLEAQIQQLLSECSALIAETATQHQKKQPETMLRGAAKQGEVGIEDFQEKGEGKEEKAEGGKGENAEGTEEKKEGGEEVVAVRKAELVRVLSEFVERREGRTRRANRLLQQEVQAGRGLQERVGDLSKALEVRTLASVAAAQNVAKLQALNDSLQAERNSVMSQLSGLTNQITGLSTSLDVLTRQQDSVSQSNTVLRTRLRKALLEKRQLAQSLRAAHRVQSERARDVEGQLRAVGAQLRASEGAMLQQRRTEEEGLQAYLSQHGAITAQRNAAVVQASELEQRVASVEARLKEVTHSRDHLFITNHELNTRLTAAMGENRLLQQRVEQLQRTSRHSAAAFRDRESTLKQHLADRHAELAASRQQAAAELAQVTSRLEAEVRAAQEQVVESKGEVRWLEAQVEALRGEGELHTARLRAAVAAAESRAQEESQRANKLQALLAESKETSERERKLLEDKVASLQSKLSETESKLASTVNSAIAAARSALLLPTPASPVDASLLSFEGFGNSSDYAGTLNGSTSGTTSSSDSIDYADTLNNSITASASSTSGASSSSSSTASSRSGGERGETSSNPSSATSPATDGGMEVMGFGAGSTEIADLAKEGSTAAGELGTRGGTGQESNEEVKGEASEGSEEVKGAASEGSEEVKGGGKEDSEEGGAGNEDSEEVKGEANEGSEVVTDLANEGGTGTENSAEVKGVVGKGSRSSSRGRARGTRKSKAAAMAELAAAGGAGAGADVDKSALGAAVDAKGTDLGTPNENDLKVYARAIFPAYVSLDASIMEQSRGVTAMVQDMVKMGADKAWAKRYVEENLLKPALTQRVAAAAAHAVGTRRGRKQRSQAVVAESNIDSQPVGGSESRSTGDLDDRFVVQ
ncbi:hypothetical protein CLOP_g24908 [Closterium sp. NIES-67]|nr:hypothetical protein CLOP_g24908 [Closterium sp. NIES-67]